MNEAIKAGEVFKLAELVPYVEGKIVNMDVAHNDRMKFVVMAFDEGTGLSEYAIALLLTSVRRIHKAYNRTREFNFSLSGLTGFDFHGKTVGVIGTGNDGVLRDFAHEVETVQSSLRGFSAGYDDSDLWTDHSYVLYLQEYESPEYSPGGDYSTDCTWVSHVDLHPMRFYAKYSKRTGRSIDHRWM